jgi:DNA-binding beta-propeller fold protein YncE
VFEPTAEKVHIIPRVRVSRKLVAAIAVLAATLVAIESAMADVSKVYWTDRDNGTLSVTEVSSGATQLLVQNFARLQDVDLDSSTGILYFADWGPFAGNSGSINRVNKDGTGLATVLNTADAVHQLALDQALQRIYFTRAVSYDGHEISHVTTGGAAYTVLLSGSGGFGGPGWFPSGLAVDPVKNLLYWGDIGVIFNPPNGSVNKMGRDGSAPTQLTPHVDGRGRGYALDQASQTIFLTAHNPQSPGTGGGLFSYDIANDIETQLISDTGTGYWDIEIDPVTQRIWWTDYGRGQIRSAGFDGSDERVELSNLTNPYGLALEFGTSVDIDIMPSDPGNNLNLRAGKGASISVAVLSVGEFFEAPNQIDPSTLKFGPGQASISGSPHARDVDGDGDEDLLVKFLTNETGIACGDTHAILSGRTFDFEPISGSDAINTFNCPRVRKRW